MTNGEAINWIINISADIGKAEHRDLWHYEQALSEIKEMLESEQPDIPDTNIGCTISKQDAINEIARWIGYLDDDMIWRIQLSLKRLPSAQLEQKKGEWVPYLTEGLRYKCSKCGSRYDTPWNFCPECGSYNGGE